MCIFVFDIFLYLFILLCRKFVISDFYEFLDFLVLLGLIGIFDYCNGIICFFLEICGGIFGLLIGYIEY